MFKKLILIFPFLGILTFFSVYGEEDDSCKYSGQIQQCLESQDNPRVIEDFVCIQGGTGDVIYQVVLDQMFKEVDEKIEEYLLGLEEDKGHYFGPEKKEEFPNGADDIEKLLGEGGEFEKEYKNLCDGKILAEAIGCSGGKSPNVVVKDYLKTIDSDGKCTLLYKASLKNYNATAYNILKDNKAQVMKDSHKKFTQKHRGKFGELLDLLTTNLGYLERFGAKLQSFTKHPHK